MGLGLEGAQDAELDDEVLKDLIMESRIEALARGSLNSTQKPSKAKKKPKS